MHLKVLTIVLWFILKQNDINNDQFNRILTIFHYKKKKKRNNLHYLFRPDSIQINTSSLDYNPPPPSQLQYKFIRVSLDSWIFFSTENNRIQSYLLLLPFLDYSGAIDLCAILSCFV